MSFNKFHFSLFTLTFFISIQSLTAQITAQITADDYRANGTSLTIQRDITGDIDYNDIPQNSTVFSDITVSPNVTITGNISGFRNVVIERGAKIGNITTSNRRDTINIEYNENSQITSIDGAGGARDELIINNTDTMDGFQYSIISNITHITQNGPGILSFEEDANNTNRELEELTINGGTLNFSNATGNVLESKITINDKSTIKVNFNTTNSDGNTAFAKANSDNIFTLKGNVTFDITASNPNDKQEFILVDKLIATNSNTTNSNSDFVINSSKIFVNDNGLPGFFAISVKEATLIATYYQENAALQINNDASLNYSSSARQLLTSLGNNINLDTERVPKLNEEDRMAIEQIEAELLQPTTFTVQQRENFAESLVAHTHATVVPSIESTIKTISASLINRNINSIESNYIGLKGPRDISYDYSSSNLSVWFDYNFTDGERDTKAANTGYNYSGSSWQLGYETSYESTFLGANLIYNFNSVKNNNNRGNIDIKTIAVDFYGNSQKDNIFVAANLLFAISDIDIKHNRLILDNLLNSTEATSFDLQLDYGKINEYNNYKTTFLTGIRYSATTIDDIIEKGSLAITSQGKTFDSLYFKFGSIVNINLKKTYETSHNLSLSGNLQVSLLDNNRNLTSKFTNGSDTFETAGVEEDSRFFTLGAIWQYKTKASLYELGYSYLFSSTSSVSNLTAKIKYKF